jgi:hypothetical protein
MTEKEFRTFVKESFDQVKATLPYLKIEYGTDFNKKKDRLELTYFCENDKKQGYGGVYLKMSDLKSDEYMAKIKQTFVPQLIKSCREHFGLIISA